MSSVSRSLALADRPCERAAAGKELAKIAVALNPGSRAVEELIDSSLPYLLEGGIAVDVVRARPGCVVLRSRPESAGLSDDEWTFLVSWLAALARLLGGLDGAVIEGSQPTPTGPVRIFTLLWTANRLPAPMPPVANLHRTDLTGDLTPDQPVAQPEPSAGHGSHAWRHALRGLRLR